MKPEERQAQILAAIDRDGEVAVPDLARRFDVSTETIRRDLGQLARGGAVQKVHGGARRLRLHVENSFEERMSEQAGEKAVIGQKLRQVIAPGDSLFIDTGTTTLACARALAEVADLTVITNSLRIARVFAHGSGHAQVFLTGGAYAPDNGETVGPMVLAQIAQFRADHAVIGVAALDPAAGALDADPDEAAIARAMCAAARQTVVVAGSAKFARRAAHLVCPLPQMEVLVADVPPPDPWPALLATASVRLI
ncbi:MAG: DeoR/GlpR transcriptional regulator [Rubellimicrobium sp.]|nr:DeoR/GlpR transcriptional regulator [Rubellimicrobium sp.]